MFFGFLVTSLQQMKWLINDSARYSQTCLSARIFRRRFFLTVLADSFFGHGPKWFWNDRKKFSHFRQNVWKYRLINTVTVSFNKTVRQMTEMFQRKTKTVCGTLSRLLCKATWSRPCFCKWPSSKCPSWTLTVDRWRDLVQSAVPNRCAFSCVPPVCFR